MFCCDHRYTQEIPEPAPFLSLHGAKIGGLQVFPVIKKKTKRWFVRCICHLHLLRSEREDKHALKVRMACENCGGFCFVFVFACVVVKNPRTPNLSPMADNAITRGSIRGLGSPLYVCGCDISTLSLSLCNL